MGGEIGKMERRLTQDELLMKFLELRKDIQMHLLESYLHPSNLAGELYVDEMDYSQRHKYLENREKELIIICGRKAGKRYDVMMLDKAINYVKLALNLK